MRHLTSHIVNGLNEALIVSVIDEPGQGGACHQYEISLGDNQPGEFPTCEIFFQNGPINEVGVNGISQEALLAIVEDRLASFQDGPYACDDNAFALDAVRSAMGFLKRRTEARVARGVEGTHQV